MRDIKFRIYDKDRKAMYHLLENKLSFGRFEGDRAVDWEDVFADKHEELEIMQYTGLKDKNGKEIYEGDIIQHEDITKGLVRYSEKYAQYVLVNTGSVKDEFEPLGDYNMEVFEIIGNEFDNPDLLEKGAEDEQS